MPVRPGRGVTLIPTPDSPSQSSPAPRSSPEIRVKPSGFEFEVFEERLLEWISTRFIQIVSMWRVVFKILLIVGITTETFCFAHIAVRNRWSLVLVTLGVKVVAGSSTLEGCFGVLKLCVNWVLMACLGFLAYVHRWWLAKLLGRSCSRLAAFNRASAVV
ncbi:hypothetical protein Droror1_Dr00001231 [Drosera rotundifolia]